MTTANNFNQACALALRVSSKVNPGAAGCALYVDWNGSESGQ